MPIYNAEATLRRVVDSVLRQTFTDFELILVNDGSTDASLNICLDYVDSHSNVKLIDQPNGGVSSARNAGMAAAIGDWITFCDSDDFVDADWLESFVENNIDEYPLIVQSFKCYDSSERKCRDEEMEYELFQPMKVTGGVISADRTISALRNMHILGYTYNKLYKTELIRRNRICFPIGVTYREDELFNVEYLSVISGQKVLITEKAAYNYYYVPACSKKYELSDYLPKTVKVLCENYSSYSTQAKGYAVDRYFELIADSFRNKLDDKITLLREFRSFIKENKADSIPTDYRLNQLSQRILKLYGGEYMVYLLLLLIRL